MCVNLCQQCIAPEDCIDTCMCQRKAFEKEYNPTSQQLNGDWSPLADEEEPILSFPVQDIPAEKSYTKVILNPITLDQLPAFIHIGFDGDEKLVEYHNKPGDITSMVRYTYDNIADAINEYGATCYKIIYGDDSTGFLTFQDIGFTVLIREPINILFSFGIRHTYRTPEVKDGWLQYVSKLFNGERYQVGLWAKNHRAISFFEKRGFNNKRFDSNKTTVVLWQQ